MHYDFDQIIDRSRNHSAKYDERKKKFGTDDVIPLWIADMDFKTAQPIIDALTARAQEGIWGYTARPESYFEAIRGWQKRRNGWDIDPKLMSFSLGVVQTISACVKLFTPEGGSVLIQTPVYSEFYDMAEAWNRKVLENRFLEHDGKWSVDWADFEEKLQQADLFLLCSPHNPLGIVWEEAELRRMMELCLKHHVLVMSDEIHSDLIMPGHKHVAFANACKDALPKYLVCTAPSKTFNLATLQTSNIVIPDEELRTKFQSILQQHFTPSAGALGLEACRLGYTECEGWLAEVIDLIYKNYKNFCKFIDVNCPGVTYSDLQGTYLMWIDCTTFGLDDEALDKLLRKHDLFCDAGTLFSQGGTMHTRVNLAGPEKMLNAAMQRFKDAYDEAKNA